MTIRRMGRALSWTAATCLILAGAAVRADYSLLVSSASNNRVERYDGATGAYLGTFAQDSRLTDPFGLTYGPDGNLYVVGLTSKNIVQFNGQTGAFQRVFASDNGLNYGFNLTFGHDNNLYVANGSDSSILRFDGVTGAALPAPGLSGAMFVAGGAGGLSGPTGILFRPDGDLLVSNYGNALGDGHSSIELFDGVTGASKGHFVSEHSGGLQDPHTALYLPNGDLLVSSKDTHDVLRFSGTDGSFLGQFVTPFSGGLEKPIGMTLGADGNLYVVENREPQATATRVLRYNGATGAFIDTFVPPGTLNNAVFATFTPLRAVPEPGSLALMAIGLAGVAAHARRRWRAR